ncbi:histone-lysine N-methyltransferase, H3 lysine-9 specific SUVH4-like [Rosa rugosa]|uniref:histone-lysine N-methyltransferase, H3 lysine-9 specific SUVH4-like n=1 Tax=Rosa rugosa TaxID=74645 RepID=UPI002B409F74|nr:histone-lysine N-methyltransferase, H3 lysine-9 specific SUVH4-like [Rosa rugosa]
MPWFLSRDVANDLEAIPIRVRKPADSTTLPEDFRYINKMIIGKNFIKLEDYIGCNCRPKCVANSCPCIQLNGSLPYKLGRLSGHKDIAFECSKRCSCEPNCVLRSSQNQLKYSLELYHTVDKGWAVRTLSTIPIGESLCEYLGLLRRIEDLDDGATETNFYLYDIDCLQQLKERGTTSNAIPGLESVKMDQCVTHRHPDITKAMQQARVILFAKRKIESLEELTLFYGYPIDSLKDEEGKVIKKDCYCGTPSCRKRLI